MGAGHPLSPECRALALRFSERLEKCITEILVAVQGLTQKMPAQHPPGASSAPSPARSDTTDVAPDGSQAGLVVAEGAVQEEEGEGEEVAEEEGTFVEWQQAISGPMDALHLARLRAAIQTAIDAAVSDVTQPRPRYRAAHDNLFGVCFCAGRDGGFPVGHSPGDSCRVCTAGAIGDIASASGSCGSAAAGEPHRMAQSGEAVVKP